MKVLSKEILKLFKFPEDSTVSTKQKVISGTIKNVGYKGMVTQAIILSTGINSSNKESYVDIRLWTMKNDTGKYVPTPKGMRFNMDQYAAFCNMLQEVSGLLFPDIKVVSIDEFLDEEIVNPFSRQAQQQREENKIQERHQ